MAFNDKKPSQQSEPENAHNPEPVHYNSQDPGHEQVSKMPQGQSMELRTPKEEAEEEE